MVRYNVNEEKRTVVAYFDGGEEAVVDGLFGYLGKKDPNGNFAFFYRRAINKALSGFNGRFVGVARCHPDDKWDVSVGEKVAREKLLERTNKLTKATAKNLTDIVFNKIGEFQNRVDGL